MHILFQFKQQNTLLDAKLSKDQQQAAREIGMRQQQLILNPTSISGNFNLKHKLNTDWDKIGDGQKGKHQTSS
jgi:hypothetical protein